MTSTLKQLVAHEPLYDILYARVSIEVFYSDRTMETFGGRRAGSFWWLVGAGSHLAAGQLARFPLGIPLT